MKMRIEKEERDYIQERDRVCLYCKDSHGPFEIDHVRPRWRGGTDDPNNLVLACHRCNQLKGGMSLVSFLSKMRLVEQGKLRIVRQRASRGKPFTFRKA